MLYFIGLGLADEKDITVKGLEIVKRAERVYLEAYTAILLVEKEQLESYYGKPITIADRDMVESSSDSILSGASTTDIAFLVVGDPFGATTHTDLLLRARSLNIPTCTIHNTSIMNAIGATGLQLYNFGQTVSIVFFMENWKPTSFYDRIAENWGLGLHTLLLLDIKVKEQSWENLARGRKVYEPPRFMTVAQCAQQLLEVTEIRREESQESVYGKESLAVGVARVGADDQLFRVGTLEQLAEVDMGRPLHSVVLIGKRVHELERDVLREWAIDTEVFDRVWARDYEEKR